MRFTIGKLPVEIVARLHEQNPTTNGASMSAPASACSRTLGVAVNAGAIHTKTITATIIVKVTKQSAGMYLDTAGATAELPLFEKDERT